MLVIIKSGNSSLFYSSYFCVQLEISIIKQRINFKSSGVGVATDNAGSEPSGGILLCFQVRLLWLPEKKFQTAWSDVFGGEQDCLLGVTTLNFECD